MGSCPISHCSSHDDVRPEKRKSLTKKDLSFLKRYDGNCQNLVQYIYRNFKDSELIDFDQEHRKAILEKRQEEGMDMEDEMTEDRKRIWKFLAENVILGENTKLNRHQIFLKDKFTLNQK